MGVQESENNRQSDIQYIDGKAFRWLIESINLQALSQHTVMTIGLCAVRDSAEGMTMALLLKTAEELNYDDIFVDWADKHTPYRYSSKKNRFVRKDGGKWDVDNAFINIPTGNKDLLETELSKLRKIHGISHTSSIDLEEFINHLQREQKERDNLIEERIDINRRKGKRANPSHPLMRQTDKDHPLIKKEKPNKKRKKKGKAKKPTDSTNHHGEMAKRDRTVSLSKEERARRKQLQEEERIIREYLSRNPLPSSVGPMGLPQSKFRYGTYGLSSMEYDAWRRS